jgi:hypothetical protein
MAREHSSRGQEVLANPEADCPPEVLKQQTVVLVEHYDFKGQHRGGAIEVNSVVAQDVAGFFALARELRFPIEKVSPASDPEYGWNDDRLMDANVTSGFNYRTIAGTNRISLHGLGLAIDVNPYQNPFVGYEADGSTKTSPEGSKWDPEAPGTLYDGHPLVEFMLGRGWEWGGHWDPGSGRVDYQHFQKPQG